jgi:transcriptional repressor NrdR
MYCPYCRDNQTRVIDTTHDARGGVRRRRTCLSCNQRFSTYERAILSAPLLVKRDGTREEFDRDKLARGLRIEAEVSSRIVGDLAIAGLKELDEIAYIRFAIVYLGFDDLNSIRSEIDRLLE